MPFAGVCGCNALRSGLSKRRRETQIASVFVEDGQRVDIAATEKAPGDHAHAGQTLTATLHGETPSFDVPVRPWAPPPT
jgi:hypothetical protein